MSKEPLKLYTTESFGELIGIDAARVRYHCDQGNIQGAVKFPGSGHGAWMIPDGAELTMQKVGRKVGYRKK
jgi:hypothetical protein